MNRPLIGGALFDIGGFPLPFFVMGGFHSILLLFGFCIFPDTPYNHDMNKSALPILPLLKIPRLILGLLVLFCGAITTDFLEPSIELHLKPFNLSSTLVGFVFLTASVTYVIATPVFGYLCDKVNKNFYF